MSDFVMPLIGGILIGLSATLMLLFNGRVAGISGILNHALSKPSVSQHWRYAFILGLLAGGFVILQVHPSDFTNTSSRSLLQIAIAGLLVGFGTAMASGCTSGHGVCGVSRLSPRSLIATGTFMFFGFVTVTLINLFVGGI